VIRQPGWLVDVGKAGFVIEEKGDLLGSVFNPDRKGSCKPFQATSRLHGKESDAFPSMPGPYRSTAGFRGNFLKTLLVNATEVEMIVRMILVGRMICYLLSQPSPPSNAEI
jgi:hypothetical protein